jgi:putative ATPase
MVFAGEDPHFLFRRMLIFASEDVGMADPNALVFTEAAAAAFDRVGLPEGRFHLAHAALYLATSPKSNSIFAFFDALSSIEKEGGGEVPPHLKDSSRDEKGFGHGEGYLYPHAFKDHWVAQQYLPDFLQGKVFYHPGDIGFESRIKPEVERKREAQLAVILELDQENQEVLTFSPPDTGRERWLNRAAGTLSRFLTELRNRLFQDVQIARHWLVLDIDARDGLLTWEALRMVPEGGVWSLIDAESRFMKDMVANLPVLDRPTLLEGDLSDIKGLLEKDKPKFNLIVGRNALGKRRDKGQILQKLWDLLDSGGHIALVESVPRFGKRLSELVDRDFGEMNGDLLDPDGESRKAAGGRSHDRDKRYLDPQTVKRLKASEERLYTDDKNPAVNWVPEELEAQLAEIGYQDIRLRRVDLHQDRKIRSRDIDHWLAPESTYTLALRSEFREEEAQNLLNQLKLCLEGVDVKWRKPLLFIHARKGRAQ